MKLWLDDLRAHPEWWTRAYTTPEAIALIEANLGQIKLMSLDHDLGDDEQFGTGYTLLHWMAEQTHGPRAEPGVWPTRGLRVHSDNAVGVQKMLGICERYGPWGRATGRTVGTFPGDVPIIVSS